MTIFQIVESVELWLNKKLNKNWNIIFFYFWKKRYFKQIFIKITEWKIYNNLSLLQLVEKVMWIEILKLHNFSESLKE